jgi:hypothetical protein
VHPDAKHHQHFSTVVSREDHMSLMGTLAKVAVGVAAAKGLSRLATGAGGDAGSAAAPAQTGGLDTLIRALVEAASGTKQSAGKAPAEGSFAEVLNQSFQ